ncbi:hypothetical protein [Helicobacter enhydrae]|nr:hypothetical protein [Helicobacter enhydrae]
MIETKIDDNKNKESQFEPAKVTSKYYASMDISLTYSQFFNHLFHMHSFNGLNFNIDTGWVLGESQNVLVGIALGGSVGTGGINGMYGLFPAIKVAGRVLEGRLIPYAKIGAGLEHLPFLFRNKQMNAYGVFVEGGLFVDIAKGYGMSLAHRYLFGRMQGLPLNVHNSSLMLGFSFYDFDLSW